MVSDEEKLIADQIAYYDALAHDYPEATQGEGELLQFAECASRALQDLDISGGTCLELACGSGRWTTLLAERFKHVTAVDASPGMLVLARKRLGANAKVTYVLADLFEYAPDRQFDVIFAGFWLSHVPQRRFVDFWNFVDTALKQGGSALIVDSYTSGMTGRGDLRKLPDGREFRIVKVEHQREELSRLLADIGWQAEFAEMTDGTYRILARRDGR